MITIKNTKYQPVRREGKPALVDGGSSIIICNPSDPKGFAYLPISQLPF